MNQSAPQSAAMRREARYWLLLLLWLAGAALGFSWLRARYPVPLPIIYAVLFAGSALLDLVWMRPWRTVGWPLAITKAILGAAIPAALLTAIFAWRD